MEPQQQGHQIVIQSGRLCKAQDRKDSRKLALLSSFFFHSFSAFSLHPHLLLPTWKAGKIKLALFLYCEFLRIEWKNTMQNTRVWCRNRAITNCNNGNITPFLESFLILAYWVEVICPFTNVMFLILPSVYGSLDNEKESFPPFITLLAWGDRWRPTYCLC